MNGSAEDFLCSRAPPRVLNPPVYEQLMKRLPQPHREGWCGGFSSPGEETEAPGLGLGPHLGEWTQTQVRA